MKIVYQISITDTFNIALKYIINILIFYLVVILIISLGKVLYTVKLLVDGDQTLVGFGVLLLGLGMVRTLAFLISPEE